MVLIREYRIVMPLTVEEYRIGQLWTVASFSQDQTGGGDGVEVLKNEPFSGKPLLGNRFDSGQYTKKKFYGQKKVNGLIRRLLPSSALVAQEESWNSYPYTRTIITNEFLGDNFYLKIDSLHLPGNCSQPNVHQLPSDKLKETEVVEIDIAATLERPEDYCRKYDPTLFKSRKTGRGLLQPGWMENAKPVMTCYKLVSVQFKWFGLQSLVEGKIQKMQQRLFTLFHRQVFCSIDKWLGMSMLQIREFERKSRETLNDERKSACVKGVTTE